MDNEKKTFVSHRFDKDSPAYQFFQNNFLHDPKDPTLERKPDAAFAKAMEVIQSKQVFSVSLVSHYPDFERVRQQIELEKGRKMSPQEVMVEMVQRFSVLFDMKISPEMEATLEETAARTGQSKQELLAEAFDYLKNKGIKKEPESQQKVQENQGVIKNQIAAKKTEETQGVTGIKDSEIKIIQKTDGKAGRPAGAAMENIKELTVSLIEHNWMAPLPLRIEINHGVLDKGIDPQYTHHYGIEVKGTRSRRVKEFLEAPQVMKLLQLHHQHMGISGRHNAEVQRRLRYGIDFEDMYENDVQVLEKFILEEKKIMKQLGMI